VLRGYNPTTVVFNGPLPTDSYQLVEKDISSTPFTFYGISKQSPVITL